MIYFEFDQCVNNTHVLDISEDNPDFIPREVLHNMPEGQPNLYIRKNMLTKFFWGDIDKLTLLRILDLSGNRLTRVPMVLSNCTKSLQKLILTGNQIENLSPDFLKDAFSLKYLDLSFNKLKYMEHSSLPDNIVNNTGMLLLHNNIFTCTCNTTWFIKWFHRRDLRHLRSVLVTERNKQYSVMFREKL